MGVRIDIVYEGHLHCAAVHGPSGTRLATDAPKDNQGKGETFSPTDLVATALGTCMATIMGIAAQRANLDIAGTRVQVVKEMAQAPVRRIAQLGVVITVPRDKAAKLPPEERQKLATAAQACPVCASLHPDVLRPVQVVFEA